MSCCCCEAKHGDETWIGTVSKECSTTTSKEISQINTCLSLTQLFQLVHREVLIHHLIYEQFGVDHHGSRGMCSIEYTYFCLTCLFELFFRTSCPFLTLYPVVLLPCIPYPLLLYCFLVLTVSFVFICLMYHISSCRN